MVEEPEPRIMANAVQKLRRRTWKQDPEGRRERILRVARREFAKKGVENARLDAIARKARVGEGTVYHLFGSKRSLLEAVGAQYGEELAEAAFSELPDDLESQLEAIVRNIFNFVRSTEGAFATFLLANDPAEGGPAEDANRNRMLSAIETYLEEWNRRSGASLNARILAQFHFNVVEGALRDCFLRGNREDEQAYIQEAVRMLVGSLHARGA